MVKALAVNRKWLKRIAKIAFFVGIVVPCCNCWSYFFLGIHFLEIPIHIRLFYGNAQFIDKLAPACGSSEIWNEYVYWWTEDNFETVSSHFENRLPDFRFSDDGQLAYATFENDLVVPVPFLVSYYPEYANNDVLWFYHSVTLRLFKLGQVDLSYKARPGHCPYRSNDADRPILKFFDNSPPEGTLIVYDYLTWVP